MSELGSLRVKREETELERYRGLYKDERVMRMTIFWLLIVLVVGSVAGTFAGLQGASHVLAVVVSGIVGTLIRNPFTDLFRAVRGLPPKE